MSPSCGITVAHIRALSSSESIRVCEIMPDAIEPEPGRGWQALRSASPLRRRAVKKDFLNTRREVI